ncbi:MAG: DUF1569 domain-containing protein [Ferruginibacter sp.]
MKTIFDQTTRDEIINRINTLNENSSVQWGKMNVCQMVKHCTLWEQMIQGDKIYKQAFIGLLFGKMALKTVLKDESPLKRNTPTIGEFVIKESTCNLSLEKSNWITSIKEYSNFHKPTFLHPFFGKMTREQVGYLVYKHVDHHLRQCNA